MKKTLTIFIFFMLATQAWAETTFTVGYLRYTVTDETNHFVSVSKRSTDHAEDPTGVLVIPDKITNRNNNVEYTVTSIVERAFIACYKLTSVTIPNSVTSIGELAFVNCSKLTEIYVESANTKYTSEDGVLFNKDKTTIILYPTAKTGTTYTIPNSVTSISQWAFQGCRDLTSITIPNSVTSIGSSAFCGCSGLTSVSIPNSVKTIDNYAFYNCSSLTLVTIPNSVTGIGESAFYGCGYATLYCEVEESSKPAGWNSGWNYDGGDVKWGCKVVRVSVNNEEYGSVTADDDNAAVKAADGSLWYLADATNIAATLTATPAENYHFVQWEDDTEAGATRTINTTASATYTAIFEASSATLIKSNRTDKTSSVRKVLGPDGFYIIKDGVKYNVLGMKIEN